MELKVVGKRLFTERIDKTITEGEYNADIIGITLDRYHDGADLSEYSFRITAYSEDGEAAAEQILAKDHPSEKTVRLLWTVSPLFAAGNGTFTLTLAGVAPDNSAQIKFTSSPIRINPDGRAEFIPDKTLAEQYLNQVQLETQKAVDAAKRAEDLVSQGFDIPAAAEEKIGGVLSGGDVSVAEDGRVTVNSVNGKTVAADVPADAKFTDTVYVLPKASENVLGGVKVDGKTVTADKNGVISAAAGEKYVLPEATANVLGGVKVDGVTITAKNGVISAVGGSSSGGEPSYGNYVLPPATESSLGGVIVDGTTITANENGVISVIGGTGGGNGGSADGITLTESGGVISVKDNSHNHTVENIPGLQTILDGKSELSHSHAAVDIEDLQDALNGKSDTSHSHGAEDISGLQTILNGKADISHSHTAEDISGLQTILDGKADISAIPTALPANGGNSATVGGFTVETNVPANAKFTDTVYTLPKATASTLGGVIVDGKTITANANGVISSLAAGNGITVDLIYENNLYWSKGASRDHHIKLPYVHTYWNYFFISMVYAPTNNPWYAYPGCLLINTSHIVQHCRLTDYTTGTGFQQYIPHSGGGINTSNIQFHDSTHISIFNADHIVIWGIKMSSRTAVGTKVSTAIG